MKDSSIRRVVIVGGGSAGWMTAAALSRLCAAGVDVTLVESDAIGTVGVGEATIPPLLDFNATLGVDESTFIAETSATYKLGIEFVGWFTEGERYFHPFGQIGRPQAGIPFHHIWLRQRFLGEKSLAPRAVDSYCVAAVAALAGRFQKPARDPHAVLSGLGYAYHFDAVEYARFLRKFAERGGVRRLEGEVGAVETNEAGFIRSLSLVDGRCIDGELFVDCTGFRSLLLGESMGVGYQSWRRWLPCDRAVAVRCERTEPLRPFTTATADAAGWRWRIPLQHRTGNGHVYSSAHATDAEALDTLMRSLDSAAISDPLNLRFEAGRRERMWVRNCVAIGLSAGFIEPLESTSIHLIQRGVTRLLSLFPTLQFSNPEIDYYNRAMIEEYEQIRDFIILHYSATNRDTSQFWRDMKMIEIPDTLAERLDLWRSSGRLFPSTNGLFNEDSWFAVLVGQGILPKGFDPIAEILPRHETGRFMVHLRDVILKAVTAMPQHAQYLQANTPTPLGRQ